MTVQRMAGNVSINGEPYPVLKDEDGNFVYRRDPTPKQDVNSTRRNASTGRNNLVSVRFDYSDGIGDETTNDDRDTIAYTLNLYTERDGEAVVLPGILRFDPDTTIPSGATDADINLMFSPPVFVWEQYMIADEEFKQVDTFFLADHRAFTFQVKSGMSISLDEDMFFEGQTRPTGGTTFENNAYAAMGGGKRTTDRYIRRRSGTDGLWTNDDNNPLTITNISAANVVTVSTVHGYAIGDVVFISGATPTTADGLWTITAVPSTTTFTIAALAGIGTGASSGTVNVQDSDVKAEHLAIVGDEMVRTSYDATNGWQTSRVDIVGSNELLEANWTAGIGTLNVGDKESIPTGLLAFGDGELVFKPEGMFKYDDDTALYANEIPELESHRHPDNGRGAFEYKGWVYVPTIIGLLRWKNGILQDVTPGRGAIQAFDTPIGPIAALTGDANRMYAATQPFQINQPQHAATTIKEFGYNLTGATPVTKTTNVFDGDQDTYLDLTGITSSGKLYFGCTEQFHRIRLQFDTLSYMFRSGGAKIVVEVWEDTNADGVGDAWVTKSTLYDGTRGWKDTDADPTTLHQTGDIVFGPLTDADSGEDTWKADANLSIANLTNGLYWARISMSGTPSTTSVLEEVDYGIHVNTAFEPMHTHEVENDHGGVVYILSMTEEQGRGVVWRHMWALTTPDYTRDSAYYGGPQRVGALKVVQPGFMRSHLVGDRYLFLGLNNICYLMPLGNHPDPTNQPRLQWYPYTDSGFDSGFRQVAIVTPYTDFGLATETKTLKEVQFEHEGIDLSGVEIWYSVDHGVWTFLGYADDCDPNMPFVVTPGSEPSGKEFAIALSYDADAERPIRLDRFGPITMRAQPRPQMAETVSLTLELELEKVMPGGIKRQAAHSQYAALKALQESAASVTFKNISGQDEYVQVLQCGQRAKLNANNRPVLYADVVLSVTTPRTDAA